jgi:site-specific recombinase XerD
VADFAAGRSKHGVHILRHSFGSALAMRGAPARAIQELMGHADIQTTQRYMHLSPASVNAAIQLLENANFRGDILETGNGAEGKS